MSIVRCEACDGNIDLDFNDADYCEVLEVWICAGCEERFEENVGMMALLCMQLKPYGLRLKYIYRSLTTTEYLSVLNTNTKEILRN